MRLSEFLTQECEKILEEWETFARTLAPGDTMGIVALRDHAMEMLTVIARDLETAQTKVEGSEKAKGKSDTDETTADTPAQEHGAGRAVSGFTVAQMVSEYRALRASVIRLWTEENGSLDSADIKDMIRFNEAVDQALAESTSRFMEDLDRTKETFLGILGHDLRNPLGAMITSAQFMVESEDLPPRAKMLAGRIVSSGERINHMISDLLDFTSSRLGVSIPLERKELDFAKVLREAVDEIKASKPGKNMFLKTTGDLHGEWDSARLSQVLSNLLGNAIAHGSADAPISVKAHGEADNIVFSVNNRGRPIPQEQFEEIFNPLSHEETASRDPNHLGLGLYIAERVVTAHNGAIEVASSEAEGTTFTVRLPRHAPMVEKTKDKAGTSSPKVRS